VKTEHLIIKEFLVIFSSNVILFIKGLNCTIYSRNRDSLAGNPKLTKSQQLLRQMLLFARNNQKEAGIDRGRSLLFSEILRKERN
jgi:hypothetical protein